MSERNIEVVRAIHAAFNAGGVDTAFGMFAANFECDMSRAIGFNVDRDLYDLAGFRRLVEEYASSWEVFELRPEEFLAAGDQVVTPFANRARGRAGIEVQGRGAFVWTVRDGAVVRACLFQERDEALKAAGLIGAMSGENVEIVRRVMDAWNRRDLGAVMTLIEPDIEVEVSIGSPIDGTYHGLQAGSGFLKELWSQFESYRSEMTECIPAGDQVFVGVLHVGTGKGSGAKVEMPGWQVWGFHSGKLISWRNLASRSEALEAAGLLE